MWSRILLRCQTSHQKYFQSGIPSLQNHCTTWGHLESISWFLRTLWFTPGPWGFWRDLTVGWSLTEETRRISRDQSVQRFKSAISGIDVFDVGGEGGTGSLCYKTKNLNLIPHPYLGRNPDTFEKRNSSGSVIFNEEFHHRIVIFHRSPHYM